MGVMVYSLVWGNAGFTSSTAWFWVGGFEYGFRVKGLWRVERFGGFGAHFCVLLELGM